MPPGIKFEKEDIIRTAFEAVRERGWDGLSARYISEKLGCSTMPIYSHFKSMKGLENAVVERGYELIERYAGKKRTGDAWLDRGVGYVLFARDEKHLFRAMTEPDRTELFREHSTLFFTRSGEALKDYPPFEGLSPEEILQIRMTRVTFVFGMACFVNVTFSGAMVSEDAVIEQLRAIDAMLIRSVKDPE